MLLSLRQDIENYISSLQLSERKPHRLYAPMHYILALKGKRIRPILTMLAYHAVSGRKPQDALVLGCGVELFHNFTLIHDDIMDNSPTRRGKMTVHEKWDINVGILSGDAMFAVGMQMVIQDFPTKSAQLANIFVQASIDVCEGQMEDMDFPLQSDVTIAEYIEMIRKKTSVLLGAALELGAVAADASEEVARLFYEFGENAGIGFQLQDDLMDAYPPEGFGKQVGGDIIENKQTYLLLKALELASDEQKNAIENLRKSETDNVYKVQQMLAIYDSLHIPLHTQTQINHYFGKAREIGENLSKHCDFKPLQLFLEEIFHRKV